MIELLALPAWNAPPRTLDDWQAGLAGAGRPPVVVRESSAASWLELAPLRLRGYVVMEGPHVAAINFELGAPDSAAAARLLESVAHALGWELHPDDLDDPDDSDDD
jgi:hypothetical protein